MDRSVPRLRIHRSFIVDPRFVIGIALVLVSALGVTWLVAAVDQTSEVYVASSTLGTGSRLMVDDLAVAHVRLGSASGHYLDAADVPDEGVVVVRAVEKGELVPMSAVGSLRARDHAQVVVSVSGPVPSMIDESSFVTLWASAAAESGPSFEAPVVLVSRAEVVSVLESSGLVAAGNDVQVELRVPRESVAAVLEAMANGSTLALVPDDEPLSESSQ